MTSINYEELLQAVMARKQHIDDLSRVDPDFNAEWRTLLIIEIAVRKMLKERSPNDK